MSAAIFGAAIAAFVGFSYNFTVGVTVYGALLVIGFLWRHKMLEKRPYLE